MPGALHDLERILAADGAPREARGPEADLAAKMESQLAAADEGFLHLKDARVLLGNRYIGSAQSMWRIGVTAIDGFLLGQPDVVR